MDAALEKEITVTKMKAAALNHRAQSVLALAELVSEYVQLTTIQQKQIDALANENKTLEPISRAIPNPTPTPAG
jgi:hypothetical protein